MLRPPFLGRTYVRVSYLHALWFSVRVFPLVFFTRRLLYILTFFFHFFGSRIDRIVPTVAFFFLHTPFAGSGERFLHRVRPSMFKVQTQLRLPKSHPLDFATHPSGSTCPLTTSTIFPAVVQPARFLGIIIITQAALPCPSSVFGSFHVLRCRLSRTLRHWFFCTASAVLQELRSGGFVPVFRRVLRPLRGSLPPYVSRVDLAISFRCSSDTTLLRGAVGTSFSSHVRPSSAKYLL